MSNSKGGEVSSAFASQITLFEDLFEVSAVVSFANANAVVPFSRLPCSLCYLATHPPRALDAPQYATVTALEAAYTCTCMTCITCITCLAVWEGNNGTIFCVVVKTLGCGRGVTRGTGAHSCFARAHTHMVHTVCLRPAQLPPVVACTSGCVLVVVLCAQNQAALNAATTRTPFLRVFRARLQLSKEIGASTCAGSAK